MTKLCVIRMCMKWRWAVYVDDNAADGAHRHCLVTSRCVCWARISDRVGKLHHGAVRPHQFTAGKRNVLSTSVASFSFLHLQTFASYTVDVAGSENTCMHFETVRSRSSKVVVFGTNRKHACNFLLVINSNRDPILPRFKDIAGFLLRKRPHSYSTQIWRCSWRTRSPMLGLMWAKTLG